MATGKVEGVGHQKRHRNPYNQKQTCQANSYRKGWEGHPPYRTRNTNKSFKGCYSRREGAGGTPFRQEIPLEFESKDGDHLQDTPKPFEMVNVPEKKEFFGIADVRGKG